MELLFCESESAFSYFTAMRSYLEQHGKPVTLYSDKATIFRVNRKEPRDGTGVTQFSRALGGLNIDIFCANTPAAKGRVERAQLTLQDRLVKELRLRRISDVEAAYFYQPTILADLAEGVRIVDEEQFGPALPVLPYRNVEEAVERANRTTFGLSGSVWSASAERGAEVASQLECGTAWVNQHLAIVPFAPFGGAKWSGIGVENGPWGLLGFTEIQTLSVAK